MKTPPSLVVPSDAVLRSYRLLLWLYPSQFRKEYGGAMALLFRDCLRDARKEGAQAVWQLWLSTLFDVSVSAPRAHLEEWTTMQASYTRPSQGGAICAFLAVFLWVLTFGQGDAFTAYGHLLSIFILLSLVLSTFGATAGLYVRVNAIRRSPTTLIGGGLGIMGLMLGLVGVVGWLGNINSDWAWVCFMFALNSLALGFVFLGIAAARRPELGPLRFAPLLPAPFALVMMVLLLASPYIGDIGSSGNIFLIASVLGGLVGTGVMLWTKAR